jgi:DNA-binding transcriptional ArsR family regulator
MVLTDVEQLKAISDPLRLDLLDAMTHDAERTWTAKELAERLGTGQTKLYHHLNLLEERGFIRVAETRVVSGIVEKRYQVTALNYRVDRQLLAGSEAEAHVGGMLDAVLEKARTDILAGVRAGLISLGDNVEERRRMTLSFGHARLSPESVKKVMGQIERLAALDELDEPDGAEYGLVIGFYPRTSSEHDR